MSGAMDTGDIQTEGRSQVMNDHIPHGGVWIVFCRWLGVTEGF